ncbi:alpha/beta-hydrolase [Apiospora hydei]|uniref:Carboxypeptidase n=1 Tax=Apiospora hydei TaxID=1337664 RepID=A0ABR1VIA8_9PEZI
MPSRIRLLGRAVVGLLGLASLGSAGVLRSRVTEGVTIDYKEPGICETTPGVKSYSGYLTLPSTRLQPYEQKLFFWFFESRDSPETAPLALWLQGGPGAASIDQALSQNGPCLVPEADGNSTVLNPWSWNNRANLLYIDQPVQTGFSYDVATPGVMDAISGDIYPAESWTGPLNYTAYKGTFPSQDSSRLVNATAVAAEATWEFLQVWMSEFSKYRREKISVWSESYGGHYAPAIAKLLQSHASEHDGALPVTVDTVGIMSGFTDFHIQAESFPKFAINNTYGIQAYDLEVAESAAFNWSSPGGCKEQVEHCRALTPNGYRDQYGTNTTITEVCGGASIWCWTNVYSAYDALSGRDPFDIGYLIPTSIPPPYAYGFLSQEWVLKALGVHVNYTLNSNPTANGKSDTSCAQWFLAAGDFAFGGFREDLASLLDDGVKVALAHGVGGEAVSLAIDYADKHDFAAAGYAPIFTNESYVGGLVRQYGRFSFSRVFQAGHGKTDNGALVGYDQPETAYQIFTRTMSGKDVSKGQVSVGQSFDYATEGPRSVFDVKSEPPAQSASECYVLSNPLRLTCTEKQVAALLEGTAVVKNNVVVSPAGRPASA